MLYDLADSNDIPLIDTWDLLGDYATANDYGLMADGAHPNKAGYAAIARMFYNALAL